jgi:hypothetical protein
MSTPGPLATCLLLSLVAGCGDRLVEFPGGSGDGDDDGGDADGGGDDDPPDAGAPLTITATDPEPDATGVSVNKRVDATFSRAMDPATLDDTTFTVFLGSSEIAGDVSYDDATHTATFTPDDPLEIDEEYTATVTTGATDPDGIGLTGDHPWSFTTDACGLATVDLRSAAAFAVVGGSTVTSTGPTMVTGDLGVSPGTAVVGFDDPGGPGTVIGTQHLADPTADQAKLDLTTAYDDAAVRSLCRVTLEGNIGGMTLSPGLYTSGTSYEISSGDLTLDAGGDEDAIFIFQMAETLTTTAGRLMILSGGAKAGNVFWQVGSSATLGTTSVFHGTIMADQSITMNTGATLNGRALAQTGAADLDSNVIVRPVP